MNFVFNQGPYEAVKSSGIDKISNPALRNMLIQFYEFTFPSFLSRVNHYNRNYTEQVDILVGLLDDPYFAKENNRYLLYQNFSPEIFNNPLFNKILRGMAFRISRTRSSIKNVIPDFDNVIELLNEEIRQ